MIMEPLFFVSIPPSLRSEMALLKRLLALQEFRLGLPFILKHTNRIVLLVSSFVLYHLLMTFQISFFYSLYGTMKMENPEKSFMKMMFLIQEIQSMFKGKINIFNVKSR